MIMSRSVSGSDHWAAGVRGSCDRVTVPGTGAAVAGTWTVSSRTSGA